MKRFICTIGVLLTTICYAFAQQSVSSGSPHIDVQVKRCFANGEDVCIDLMITGHGKWKSIVFYGDCDFYDDEGNRYNGGLHGRNTEK